MKKNPLFGSWVNDWAINGPGYSNNLCINGKPPQLSQGGLIDKEYYDLISVSVSVRVGV